MSTAGAHIEHNGVRFELWAPKANEIALVIGEDRHAMEREDSGVFHAFVGGVGAGTRYAYEVDGQGPFPDPRSRFQPDGVHGPSEVIDLATYDWSDGDWPGLTTDDLIIYELHVGAMTNKGTFRALIDELPELARLGVTAIELMPVAECPGRWNWGYDGVSLYAPSCNYGRPEDFQALVDAAHRNGLGVILDVVYNHLGPEGNYLGVYSDRYISETHTNSWGAGLNWDSEDSRFVRDFAIDNAVQWIRDYHIDGLRLDATHAIVDDSDVHLVQELTTAARAAAGNRAIYVVAEDERREITRARPLERGGEGLDAVWADDFHHEVRVLLTNAQENYYAKYSGTTASIATAINEGFGDEGHDRGTPPDAEDPASCFVFCIQNHDQVGNRPFGDRLHHEINLDRYKVASALLLVAPETPLLFMGQEFAASSPFLYFTDHPEELGKLVTEGRRKEFAGFRLFDDPELRESIPDPQAESTFRLSKLDLTERQRHADIYELYQTWIHRRKSDPVLRSQDRRHTKASWLTAEMVSVRRWEGNEHRVLLANFGNAAEVDQAAFGQVTLRQVLTTGADATLTGTSWRIPPRTAVLLST